MAFLLQHFSKLTPSLIGNFNSQDDRSTAPGVHFHRLDILLGIVDDNNRRQLSVGIGLVHQSEQPRTFHHSKRLFVQRLVWINEHYFDIRHVGGGCDEYRRECL